MERGSGVFTLDWRRDGLVIKVCERLGLAEVRSKAMVINRT